MNTAHPHNTTAIPSTFVPEPSQTPPRRSHAAGSIPEQMKDIQKAKLRRRVMEDPSLARKLVAMEASPIYNERAALIQAVAVSSVDGTV